MMDLICIESSELVKQRWTVDGPVMVMPYTDPVLAVRAGEFACKRAGAKGLVLAVHDAQRQGFVATVNAACAATQSPWVGYMAQDAFAGRDWMGQALQTLHREAGVLLGFNDGKWHGALASFGLAKREWVTGVNGGGVFYPGYARHYADVELTLLALQASGYVYNPDSVLMEVDWGKDATAVHRADRVLYRERVAQGFDGRVREPLLLGMFQ